MRAVTPDLDGNLADLFPDRRTLLVVALLVNTQGLLTVGYLALADVSVYAPRYLLYPWLWIDAALLAVWKSGRPAVDAGVRRRSLAIAGVYGLVLAVAAGIVSLQPGALEALLGGGHAHQHGGLSVHWRLPPGMGPAVLFQNDVVRVALLPYKVIGYAALAFLVYVGLLEAAGSTLSGIVGLFSCVSCAWPVLGAVVTTLFGSGSALAVAATTWPYDVSTVVFLTAVALLYWRPSW